MGLDLLVGVLSQPSEDDEAEDLIRVQLKGVNALLARAGLGKHEEPERCEVWSVQAGSYSWLHYLRRIAAHLELHGRLPEPGGPESSNDPVANQYYDLSVGAVRGWRRMLGKGKPRRQSFDHLMIHSDAEGFYVPMEFEAVLLGDEQRDVLGGMLGSSHQLLRECERLREALEIPETLTPEDDELWEAAESQGEGSGWRRYGVESFSCVALLHGARQSIEQRALLLFC